MEATRQNICDKILSLKLFLHVNIVNNLKIFVPRPCLETF